MSDAPPEPVGDGGVHKPAQAATPLDSSNVLPRSGLWERLDDQLGLVSLRPKLADDVRVRHIGDEWELVQISSRRVLALTEDEATLVSRFDGTRTVAEIIVEGMGAGTLAVDPVLTLVDRLVRSEMLAQYPPHLYRQIINHLARLAVDRKPGGEVVNTRMATGEVRRVAKAHVAPERKVWRPRTPVLAERARFLRDVSLLAELDMHAIGALAEAVSEEMWPAASDIVSEGAESDRFFIVRSGDVDVSKIDEAGVKQRIAKLGSGEWFGEAGLVSSSPRNATVRAGMTRPVQLYTFDTEVFERLISPYVATLHGRQLVSRKRARIEEVPLFQALAPSDLDRLARVMREERSPKGTVLFRQGESAESFYVIAEGAVGVVKDGTPIARLGEGEFFGETALLFTEQRTATIATTEDSRFWVLEREAFTTFVRDALLHRRDLMPTVMNRISSTEPI